MLNAVVVGAKCEVCGEVPENDRFVAADSARCASNVDVDRAFVTGVAGTLRTSTGVACSGSERRLDSTSTPGYSESGRGRFMTEPIVSDEPVAVTKECRLAGAL